MGSIGKIGYLLETYKRDCLFYMFFFLNKIKKRLFKTESLLGELKRDYLFYFSRHLNKVMVEPDMIQLMLTNKCNIRCKICDVWKQKFGNELTTKEVKSLINQAINMGIKTIYFTGGEVLLREDIFELIDFAFRPGVVTAINTNGSLVTEGMAKKIVLSKLDSITFSIDSANPKIHNSIRGKDVFENAMLALDFISYYKKKFGREDGIRKRKLSVCMLSVIMKDNMGELLELVKLAEKMQCRNITFQPLVYNGNLLENYDVKSDFWINEESIPKLENALKKLEVIKKEMAAKGFIIDFMLDKTIQHFKKEKRKNTCFAGFSRIFINPQGDVSFVCCESFNNFKDSTLKKSWLSEKAYSIRERIRSCEVNCTQFCSERPQSEDVNLIHIRLKEGIKNLSLEAQEKILGKEYSFLKNIFEKIKLNTVFKKEDFSKVENLINSLKDKANGRIGIR